MDGAVNLMPEARVFTIEQIMRARRRGWRRFRKRDLHWEQWKIKFERSEEQPLPY